MTADNVEDFFWFGLLRKEQDFARCCLCVVNVPLSLGISCSKRFPLSFVSLLQPTCGVWCCRKWQRIRVLLVMYGQDVTMLASQPRRKPWNVWLKISFPRSRDNMWLEHDSGAGRCFPLPSSDGGSATAVDHGLT